MTTPHQQRAAAAREQAQAVRQQRKASSKAQVAAQQIRDQLPQLTAQTPGPAMDPAAGFSFNPHAPLPQLPRPGETPGGAPQGGPVPEGAAMSYGQPQEPQQPQDQLPDDRDLLAAMGIAPQQATVPPPAPRPQANLKQEHSVLQSLRQDLGIDHVERKHVQVGGHRWTLQALTHGDVAAASRLADQLSTSLIEHQLYYQTAIAAHSIVAIDQVPTWQVFGVSIPAGAGISDPYRPPRSVRVLAAQQLYDFILDDTRTQLSERLYEAYVDQCDQDGAVASYLDEPGHARVKVACITEGCSHEAIERKRTEPYYCKYHGTPMEVAAEVNTGPLA